MAKRKSVSKVSKKQGPTVIHYTNFVDFTEVAAILIGHLETAYAQSPMMALQYSTLDIPDPAAFGQELALIFTAEDVTEILTIDQGPGILLGMYLAKKEFEAYGEEQQEQEVGRDF